MNKKIMPTIISIAIILLLICLVSESFLFVFCHFKGLDLNKSELISSREKALKDLGLDLSRGQNRVWENSLEIHPFFGYVYNSDLPNINNFGFRTKYNISLSDNKKYSLENKSNGKPLTIGIFGGSFADVIGRHSDLLEKKLAALFSDKTPVVINFGVGGHALPQSAFIFIYFKDLLDIAVFIDGLNEIWNPIENNKVGYPPEYAKATHFNYMLSSNRLTPETFHRTLAILRARKSIKLATEISLTPIIRRSLLVHYTWVAWIRLMNRYIYANYLAIEKNYQTRGKFFSVDDDSVTDFAIQQWKNHHFLIHNIAHSENILDIHLLQPNPFVAESKPLTDEENELINNSYPVEDFVVAGYSKLQQAAADLKTAGLLVEDLSYIFKDVKVSAWSDSCHTNDNGSKIILNRITELISENYR